jgi:hypothetical protein
LHLLKLCLYAMGKIWKELGDKDRLVIN